jgi:hypothetical protein
MLVMHHPKKDFGIGSYIRLVHFRLSRILERLQIIFSCCLNIEGRAWGISWLSVYIWVRVWSESEGHLNTYVVGAVAVAAVAFPLAADGVFLTAAILIAG